MWKTTKTEKKQFYSIPSRNSSHPQISAHYHTNKAIYIKQNYLYKTKKSCKHDTLQTCDCKGGHRKITTTGIYPNTFDVCYTAQKTQSYNCVFKLNVHIDIYFCLLVCFCFCSIAKLLEFIYSSVFSNQNYMFHICSCLTIFQYITYIIYLNIQKMKI